VPQHRFEPPRGRLEEILVDSTHLAGNLLGDPAERRVAVYLPEGYENGDRAYPLFVSLAGFTGSGLKQLAWRAFEESLPQRIDRLVQAGLMGPAIFAFPDGFTSLGGNQYVDTPVMGRWESFLVDEMVPSLERAFRLLPSAASRAIFGKSSGGYGALIQGMRHGDRWGGVACHSGDMGFEGCYRGDFPRALVALAARDGSIETFLESLSDSDRIGSDDFHALMTLAMAASYDPDSGSPLGIRLPMDPHTCEVDPERWASWLNHDPVELIERAECRDNLLALRLLFVDCGRSDEYNLQFGARRFATRLSQHGVPHTYEEFDGTHSGIDHRLDSSLPLLYSALDV